MDLETLKKSKDYLAAQMAYYSAANAVTLGEASGALKWPFLGEDRSETLDDPAALGDAMVAYSGFVRANPTAPAEALFRFGAGREHHGRDGETWSEVEFVWRSAFTVFHRTLPIFDELIAAEIAALEAAEFRKRMAPTLAALSLPEEDTILERFGTIFETSPNVALKPIAVETDLGLVVAALVDTTADEPADQADTSGTDAGTTETETVADQADTSSTDAGATETTTVADQADTSSTDAGATETETVADQADTSSTDAGATETTTVADQSKKTKDQPTA